MTKSREEEEEEQHRSSRPDFPLVQQGGEKSARQE